jgi:hypothetical protein
MAAAARLRDRLAADLADAGVCLPGDTWFPVGGMAGALSVARGERLAAGAEWSPYSQRQALVAEVHAARRVACATRRHHEPSDPATTPALGLAYAGGDLYDWLRTRGRATEVVVPQREQRLAMAVLGIPAPARPSPSSAACGSPPAPACG